MISFRADANNLSPETQTPPLKAMTFSHNYLFNYTSTLNLNYSANTFVSGGGGGVLKVCACEYKAEIEVILLT